MCYYIGIFIFILIINTSYTHSCSFFLVKPHNWTDKDETKLLEAYEKHGNQPQLIANSYFNGNLSAAQVKVK